MRGQLIHKSTHNCLGGGQKVVLILYSARGSHSGYGRFPQHESDSATGPSIFCIFTFDHSVTVTLAASEKGARS